MLSVNPVRGVGTARAFSFPGIAAKTRRSHCLIPPRLAAFVLLEVLVSLAILGLAISTTLRSFTTSLNAAKMSRNVTLATMLARNQLEKWEIVYPHENIVTGTFAPDYPQFSFEARFRREPLRYEERIASKAVPTMIALSRVEMNIYFTPRSGRNPQRQRVLNIESAVTKAEKFNSSARLFNEIEFED